jgi:hypothetical protein
MTLDDFIDFLISNSVPHKTTYQSIILSNCPGCGTSKDKIYLFKERLGDHGPFHGKCMKCDEKINSHKYLTYIGFSREVVNALHGNVIDDFKIGMMPMLDIFGKNEEKLPNISEPAPEVEDVDISNFVKITDYPNHPASLYAKRRGWSDTQADDILIDYYSMAVVFVIRENGKVVGFQRRFINPVDPADKVRSSRGFQKRRFVIEYPNQGDICVCEGPFTGLSAWHFGYHAIVTFGANVGELQLDKMSEIANKSGKNVAIAFDLDDAGRKGYLRIRNTMFWRDIASYRVKPEQGNDLNDSHTSGKGVIVVPESDAVLDAIKLPFKEFQ